MSGWRKVDGVRNALPEANCEKQVPRFARNDSECFFCASCEAWIAIGHLKVAATGE